MVRHRGFIIIQTLNSYNLKGVITFTGLTGIFFSSFQALESPFRR